MVETKYRATAKLNVAQNPAQLILARLTKSYSGHAREPTPDPSS